MKRNYRDIIKKPLLVLLFSLIYLGLGYLAALLITNRFSYKGQDVMAFEGIILFIAGILMSMKGNPSGASFSGMGQKNVTQLQYHELEITRQQRENNPYYKDYLKNNIVEVSFSNITFILGGILIMVCSYLLF